MTDLRLTLTVPETNETIRVFGTPESPWWVASDVARVLGLAHGRMTTRALAEDERGVKRVDTPGGPQDVIVLNEMGLYRFILRSRKKSAERFKSWIVREVVPSIRRFGCYPPPATQPEPAPADGQPTVARTVLALAQVVVGLEDRVAEQGRRLARVEANQAVAGTDLVHQPAPVAAAPKLTDRALVIQRVNLFVRATTSCETHHYRNAWSLLFGDLRLRCHFDAKRRAAASGLSALDEVERAGLMPTFYAIAYEVLKPPARPALPAVH